MPESKRELQEMALARCQTLSNHGEVLKIRESKPYMKKINIGGDKSQWSAWEIQVRIRQKCDTYITVMRRKYIPPMMDKF